jgi:hypothetical protein
VPNDLLVIAATTVESEVIVIAAYILTRICVELHTTRNLPDSPLYMEKVARNVVAPLLGLVGIALVVLLVLAVLGVLGDEQNCHQLAWFLISSCRAVCVVVSTVSAGLIQQKMSTMAVSEGYRKSKIRMVWLVAVVFILATVVELGNDAWAATRPAGRRYLDGACWKWSSISIDIFSDGDGAPMLSLRVLVRTVKYFLPMWAVLAFFKALMPERQVKNRAMSWASGIGGGDNEDEWSTISGCTPRGARTRPLMSGGGGSDDGGGEGGGETIEPWGEGAEALYARAERRRSSGGLAAVVGVVDDVRLLSTAGLVENGRRGGSGGGRGDGNSPRRLLGGRDLLRESSGGSVQ